MHGQQPGRYQAPVVVAVVGVATWVPFRLLYGQQWSGTDWLVDLLTALVALHHQWPRLRGWLNLRSGQPGSEPQALASPAWRLSFGLDVLLALPLDQILRPWLGEEASWALVLKLLLLHRVSLVRSWFEGLASLHPVVYRVLPILLYLPPFVHLLACGWIALGSGTAGPDSDHGVEYVRAVYWTLSTLTTVGYGDITPKTPVQMLYVCATQLLGVGVFGFVLSNVASVLSRLDAAREHHVSQVDRLETFMAYNRLPTQLRGRVREWHRYLWESRQGYEDAEVLTGLPGQLRAEITLHLNRDMLGRIPLLSEADDEFLEDLMLKLQATVAVPGERIFHVDEPGDAMYFIRAGEVEIVDRQGTTLAVLQSGNFFGEMALLSGGTRSATARARSYCDLFRLHSAALHEVAHRYPQFEATLQVSARVREAATGERVAVSLPGVPGQRPGDPGNS